MLYCILKTIKLFLNVIILDNATRDTVVHVMSAGNILEQDWLQSPVSLKYFEYEL